MMMQATSLARVRFFHVSCKETKPTDKTPVEKIAGYDIDITSSAYIHDPDHNRYAWIPFSAFLRAPKKHSPISSCNLAEFNLIIQPELYPGYFKVAHHMHACVR